METQGKGKLLILDDDAGVLLLAKKTLERQGYSVLTASTPAEAQSFILSTRGLDLLVLDYQLGSGLTGLDFFTKLNRTIKVPPAILATGFSDENRLLEAVRAGMRDVIRKSDDYLEQLPLVVERVLREVGAERKLAAVEAANRAKDHFLAVLSHELRTPLTPVLTTAVAMESDPSLPATAREAFAMIRRNVELEARLIDDLLDLTRISRGKLVLSMQHLDLREAIESVVQMCGGDCKDKAISLKVELDATNHQVFGDSARLQQVLWNILKNAVKFTPEHGTILFRTSNPTPGQLRVEVTDSGIGISPEMLSKVFDAFEQGEQGFNRQFGGLGLGLAIARALVVGHQGTIQAISEGAGKGATFRIEIPLAKETAPAPSAPTATGESPEPANHHSVRILVVDDHIDTVKAMSRLLKVLGHRVTTAESVASALQAMESGQFDLLISDIGLPDGSGLDLMRQVRQTRPLPGIVLSGFGMEDDMASSREAGFVDHLTKPVNLEQLKQAIAKAVAAKA